MALLWLLLLLVLSTVKAEAAEWELLRPTSKSEAVGRACSATLYPDKCMSSLMSFNGLPHHNVRHTDVMSASLNISIDAVHRTDRVVKHMERLHLDKRNFAAVRDCVELLGDTIDEIHDTMSDLKNASFLKLPDHAPNLRILLSGAITNEYTCIDGFSHTNGTIRHRILGRIHNITHFISNSLAMIKNTSDQISDRFTPADAQPRHKRRLLESFGDISDGFPEWMSAGDRRLLQANSSELTPNAVVAKDGSGDFTTIAAALAAAPNKSSSRYIIKINAGTYHEYLDINKKKTNIMLIGDGMHKTFITGSRNVIDGSTTFRSATVAVTGQGFIARDMTFENTAGAEKHQAVALRSGADHSVFYRCAFKGYQDTLYAHSLRQFYRECEIYGTVDFVFGNAAVVIQDSKLYARKPMEKQTILYTAQGREDPNENTGIVLHNCHIAPTSEYEAVKSSFKAYLGRPWKKYSRTVVSQSHISDIIEPRGWLEWNATFALDTLYYAEYKNRGPGSNTTQRVTWPGYHVINDTDAVQFTVSNFIDGDAWLTSTGVNYTSGLI